MSLKRTINIIFWITFFAYLARIALLFYPFTGCTNQPVLKYDFAHHYTNTINTSQYLRHELDDLGYNPFFSAGLGESQESSTRILIPFFALLNTNSPLLYNILIFLILAILPLLFQLTVFIITRSNNQAKISFVNASLVLIGSRIGQEFIFIGHFGFLLSVFLSFCAIAFLWDFFIRLKNSSLYLHAIILGITCWTHLLTPIVIAPFVISIFAFFWKEKKKYILRIISLWIPFIFLPNMIWIPNFLTFLRKYYNFQDMNSFLQTDTSHAVEFLADPFFIIILLLVFATLTLKKIQPTPKTFLIIPIMIYFLLIATAGSQIGLEDLQPIRFYIPLLLLTSLSFIWFNEKWKLIGIASLSIAAIILPFSRPHLIRPLGCGIQNNRATALFHFIKHKLDKTTRLHIQDSVYTPYFESRLTALIPHYTKQPVLSSPYLLPYRYENFIDSKIFGNTLSNFSPEEFLQLSDLYNVSYYLVFSDEAREFLSSKPQLVQIYHDAPYSIFEIKNNTRSYALNQKINVKIEINRIEVSGANENETILKFYDFTSFKIDPPTITRESYPIKNNPQRSFIKVHNGPHSRFTIYN